MDCFVTSFYVLCVLLLYLLFFSLFRSSNKMNPSVVIFVTLKTIDGHTTLMRPLQTNQKNDKIHIERRRKIEQSKKKPIKEEMLACGEFLQHHFFRAFFLFFFALCVLLLRWLRVFFIIFPSLFDSFLL